MEKCPKFHAGHTKNGPNGKTEQILFTLENMHQVDSSLLFSPRCDVTAAIVTGLFISSQILWCVFISRYSQMAQSSWAISLGWSYHQCLGAQHLLCDASLDSMHFVDPGIWGQWGALSWITTEKSVGSRGQDKRKKGECLSLLKPRFAEQLIRHSDQEHRSYKPTLLGLNLCWTA